MTIIEGEVIPSKAPSDEIVVHEPQAMFNETAADETAATSTPDSSKQETPHTETNEIVASQADAGDPQTTEGQPPAEEPEQPAAGAEIDALRLLVNLLVGGAIEGTSQLTSRLQSYEKDLQEAKSAKSEKEEETPPEDELVLLRYALVGFIFDTEARLRRTLPLVARLMNTSANISGQAARPLTNSRFFSPIRRRYERLVQRGDNSVQKWIALGRNNEPHSRDLAKMTYNEIIDEFIGHLAENPEIQTLVQQQSIGLATEMRDEVRGRGVTADTLLENLVRRVLRRTPREALPGPPPEVQQWAGVTMDDFRATQLEIESQLSQSSPANEPND